jgi:hypothetical protein
VNVLAHCYEFLNDGSVVTLHLDNNRCLKSLNNEAICMFIPDFHDGLLAFILEYLIQFHVAGFSTEYGLISSGSRTCITNFPYLEFFLKLANLTVNFTSS